jgi:endonuclease/exonuclease/phosphatase (EEP) superfamily protein YafD
VAVAGWLYLAAVLGAWALLRAGDLWGPATLLMFSPRWVLALPPLVLAPAAAAVRRRALGPVILGLVLALGPVMGFCVPWGRLGPDPGPGFRFRVLTCNMHHVRVDPAPLDRLVVETWPDVVALQEWRDSARSDVLARADWHVHRVQGLCLASRHPVRRAEWLGADSLGERGSVARYEIDTPAGLVTVFNLHLATPRFGLMGVAREGWDGLADLRANSARRREQSEYVAREAERAAGPVVVVGDFNTPPESALFRRVWGGYTDAFAAAGWGWGYTFISRRTVVRIDHVLAGPGWRCDHCRVGPDVGSPHRPVIADLTWPAAGE